jgi:hypothetical protein
MAVFTALVGGIAVVVATALVAATCSAIAKVCLDAVIQRDLPETSRASAFGRSETVLQLAWVVGGALGVLLPPTYWIGFTTASVLLALGLVQTLLVRRGSSLIPGLGAHRPRRSPATGVPQPDQPGGARYAPTRTFTTAHDPGPRPPRGDAS